MKIKNQIYTINKKTNFKIKDSTKLISNLKKIN